MFIHITDARYVGGYRVEVTFNNGRKGVADFEESLDGPVFEPLKDVSEFSKLRVNEEMQTIVWPDGTDMPPDMAPEYIYFLAFRDDLELQEQFRAWGYID